VQSFVSLVYNIDFWLNKDYIAANFCVNKNKPQMNCNGKCFLIKEKQDAEKQSQQPNNNKKNNFEIKLSLCPTYRIFDRCISPPADRCCV